MQDQVTWFGLLDIPVGAGGHARFATGLVLDGA